MQVSPTYEQVCHAASGGHGVPGAGRAGGQPTGLFGLGLSAAGGGGPLEVLAPEPPAPPELPEPPEPFDPFPTVVVQAAAKRIVRHARALVVIRSILPVGTLCRLLCRVEQEQCRDEWA
jgi:hypothetical protein